MDDHDTHENDEEIDQGYVDQLEEELLETEAFIHKKGLTEELDKWRESDERDQDIEEYEKAVEEEADELDPEDI